MMNNQHLAQPNRGSFNGPQRFPHARPQSQVTSGRVGYEVQHHGVGMAPAAGTYAFHPRDRGYGGAMDAGAAAGLRSMGSAASFHQYPAQHPQQHVYSSGTVNLHQIAGHPGYGGAAPGNARGGRGNFVATRGAPPATRGGWYGPGRGASHPMAFAAHPQQSFRPAPEPQDVCVIVHLNEFDDILKPSPKAALSQIVGADVLAKLQRNHGAPRNRRGRLRAFVVVRKMFLIACLTFPKAADDIVMSEEISRKYLDISCAVIDNGSPLVGLADGEQIPKHLAYAFRQCLTSLAPFEKPEAELAGEVNLTELSPSNLAQKLLTTPHVMEAVESKLQSCDADDTHAMSLFEKILSACTELDAASAGKQDAAHRPPTLFSVAQGTYLLKIIFAKPILRKLFFDALLEGCQQLTSVACIAASKSASGTSHPARDPATIKARALFKMLFTGVLTPALIFDSFGVAEGAEKHNAEIDILCRCVIAFGDTVFCENGGSCIVTALLKKVAPLPMADDEGAGAKKEEHSYDSSDVAENGHDHSGVDSVPHGDKSCTSAPRFSPASIDEIVIPDLPEDMRLLHAIAAAFTGVVKAASNTEDAVATAMKAQVQTLTQHIIACRTVQVVLPYFIIASTQSDIDNLHATFLEIGSPEDLYRKRAIAFADELCGIAMQAMMSNYGNYVIQTLITDSVPYGAPGTFISSIVETILGLFIDNIFDMSIHKFASNCAEKAIDVFGGLPKGSDFVLRIARALLSKGPQVMTDLALQQYGNYVLQRLLNQLTRMATKELPCASEQEQLEAVQLEKTYYDALSSQYNRLRQTSHGAGILIWLQKQRDRLHMSKQSPAVAAVAAAVAAAAAAEAAAYSRKYGDDAAATCCGRGA